MITSPMKAIRAKCIECSGGSMSEVRLCTMETCALFPFRLGKNPFRAKREYTEEEREQMRERMAKMREMAHNKEMEEDDVDEEADDA